MTVNTPSTGEPLLNPPPTRWSLGAAANPGAELFRKQLGLADSRPVIMTGHQAQFWHPGILAKYLAADAFARRTDSQVAWLVVDQDINDAATIRLPVRDSATNSLHAKTWRSSAATASEEVPTGRRRGSPPTTLPELGATESFAAACIAPGLDQIRAALAARGGEPSAAAQIAMANADLLATRLNLHGQTVLSLAISSTTAFAELIDRIRRDPNVCIETYNRAVAAHPRERIQPLRMHSADNRGPELPLWHTPPGFNASRRRVHVEDLKNIPAHELAPRALLMTGLLRALGCDLFIHGTGGGGANGPDQSAPAAHEGYDRITDDWFRDWLGWTLAPVAVATATLHLPIAYQGPTADDLRRATWLAHAAEHEPALVGGPSEKRTRFVSAIREAKRVRRATPQSSNSPRAMYKQMHAWLADQRAAHTHQLTELKAQASTAAERLTDAQIAHDRTWAWPLYEDDQLAALKRSVDSAFGV